MTYSCENCGAEIKTTADKIAHFDNGLCGNCKASLDAMLSEEKEDEELELMFA